MATVHLILNAHIDPVWLWPWQGGLDEVVATCRSACERLDRHSDLIFTRGEAWAYDVVERIDPPLFKRIARHIQDGRWEVVGGWWIQPDCNLPSRFGMARQIELGRDYFMSRFGRFPRVGYNVDSFGHAAFLPRLMNDYGQDRYVMMRPQEHELTLPSRIFRWRGSDGASEVTAFRIAYNYETVEITDVHLLASLEELPAGARHTMCFIGVGDHGGGPTERQIAWCREHATAFAGHELVFSSPSRFFDAVEAERLALPVVEGELQQHAPGCYSVERRVKTGLRQAEHGLRQAEIALTQDPEPEAGAAARLTEAWRWVCFNQFHDTLGGSAIPSAYGPAHDQLGSARAAADEMMQFAFRRRLAHLPADSRQRIAILNASDAPFDGWLTLAPWTEARWEPGWRLRDGAGAPVPYQLMQQEALTRYGPQVAVRATMAPGALQSLFIDREPANSPPIDPAPLDRARATPNGTLAAGPMSIAFAPRPALRLGTLELTPELILYEDMSDTWSHGLTRYEGAKADAARWDAAEIVDTGPLLAAALQLGRVGDSDLGAEWRVHADGAAAELLLSVDWRARHKILKLGLRLPEAIEARIDGVLGGAISRHGEKRERPLRDFTLVRLTSGMAFGVVCPDVFAIDADEEGLRLTLLRSPFMAHHEQIDADQMSRRTLADQGPHRFRFQFLAGRDLEIEALERRALMLQRPPLVSDWTNGMTCRSSW